MMKVNNQIFTKFLMKLKHMRNINISITFLLFLSLIIIIHYIIKEPKLTLYYVKLVIHITSFIYINELINDKYCMLYVRNEGYYI